MGAGRRACGVSEGLHRRPVVWIAPQVAGLVGRGPRRGFGGTPRLRRQHSGLNLAKLAKIEPTKRVKKK